MNFEIRNGDVLEELEKLNAEGRRFDALLADPPYCSGSMSPGSVMQGASSSKYCQSLDLPTFVDAMSQCVFQSFTYTWLKKARPLLRSPGYVFIYIDWRQIPAVSEMFQAAGYVWRGLAVWDKRNARCHVGQHAQTAEFIVWGTVDEGKSDKYGGTCVFSGQMPSQKDRIHPTQKNVDVIKDLFRILPDDATDVLEPFSGSGAGGIAALSLGYNYTGIEQSEEFVTTSRERLTNALKVYETTGTLVDDVNNQRELLFV